MTEAPDEITVTLVVTSILDRLQIPYLIAGGLASIIHGEVRTTLDVDLLADLRAEHVSPLAAAVAGGPQCEYNRVAVDMKGGFP